MALRAAADGCAHGLTYASANPKLGRQSIGATLMSQPDRKHFECNPMGLQGGVTNRPQSAATGVGRLEMVQIMRALAALAVLVQHSFHEAQRFNPSPHLVPIEQLPWHIGVDLFFVISGFIMMHTAAATFGQPGAPRAFILRRLIRIVPPYWFFTTLMIIASLILADRLNTSRFEFWHALQSYLFIPHPRPGLEHQIHPILALGWTLLYEMFFYVAFAAALFVHRDKGLAALFLAFLALFAGAKFDLFTPGLNIFWSDSIMFTFFLGILAWLALREDAHPRSLALLVGFGFAGILFGWTTGLASNHRLFLLDFPALLIFLALYHVPLGRGANALGLVALGDASYALYLSHPFTVNVLSMAVIKARLAEWFGVWATTGLYIALCLAVSAAFAFVFWRYGEAPLTKALIKRWLKP